MYDILKAATGVIKGQPLFEMEALYEYALGETAEKHFMGSNRKDWTESYNFASSVLTSEDCDIKEMKESFPPILGIAKNSKIVNVRKNHFLSMMVQKDPIAVIQAFLNLERWNEKRKPDLSAWANTMRKILVESWAEGKLCSCASCGLVKEIPKGVPCTELLCDACGISMQGQACSFQNKIKALSEDKQKKDFGTITLDEDEVKKPLKEQISNPASDFVLSGKEAEASLLVFGDKPDGTVIKVKDILQKKKFNYSSVQRTADDAIVITLDGSSKRDRVIAILREHKLLARADEYDQRRVVIDKDFTERDKETILEMLEPLAKSFKSLKKLNEAHEGDTGVGANIAKLSKMVSSLIGRINPLKGKSFVERNFVFKDFTALNSGADSLIAKFSTDSKFNKLREKAERVEDILEEFEREIWSTNVFICIKG
jgi:hypothetical protein